MKYSMFILFALGLLLQACGGPHYSYLTQEMIEDNSWTENDLGQMQFFLSQDLVLQKIQSGGMTEIKEGKVNVTKGEKIDEIYIKEGTPGVLQFMPETNRIAVTFEDGDQKFLMFGPNPDYGNRYVLLGSMWNDRGGVISYNGDKYVTATRSAHTSLLLDMQSAKRIQKRTRVVGGKTVN